MSTLLIQNIRSLVSCDDADTVYENVDLYAEDGFIRAIGKNLPQEAEKVIDASHMLCYPGLVNTHHHLYQQFSRNLPQVQNMELFDWLKTLYEIWKNLDTEVVHASSLTGMGELMKHGCTTCFDHHYVFPASAGDLIGAQFAASDEIGARMYASRGSMDLSVKDGGLPPDSVVQTVDEIMADSARVIEKYHDKSFGAMHRVALAPCSPFSVSADLLRESAVLAREYGVRLHTHLCETKDEENFMLAREGVRPLEYMERLGWTGDAQVFVRTASLNFDVERFFKKWLHDLAADQGRDGCVPHVIPNIFDDMGGSSAWSDAAVICPWEIYRTYGDKAVLEEQFDSMKAWIDWMRERSENGRRLPLRRLARARLPGGQLQGRDSRGSHRHGVLQIFDRIIYKGGSCARQGCCGI